MAGAGSNLDEADTTTTMPNLPALTNGTAGETQENKSYKDNIAALLVSSHIKTFVMTSVVRSDG